MKKILPFILTLIGSIIIIFSVFYLRFLPFALLGIGLIVLAFILSIKNCSKIKQKVVSVLIHIAIIFGVYILNRFFVIVSFSIINHNI